MFSQISVLVPTRGRLSYLRTMLTSFDDTSTGRSTLIFRVDDDDTETQAFLADKGHTVRVGPRLDGYRSLPAFYNELALASTGDVLMVGNDDMVFRTVGWDQTLLDAANRYPDGVFAFGVATHNHMNFPFATVSRKVVDTLGFIYDPRIFWGDIYMLAVMSAFGRAISMPQVVIDHDWMGFHPDQTFNDGAEVRGSNWMTHHQTAVDEAVVKLSEDPAVRALRETPSKTITRGGMSIIFTESLQ